MPSVYQENNFQGRVNFAASYISQQRPTTRAFDTCFEMNDGDLVATALFRRAQANPAGRLALNLFKYIREDITRQNAETYANVETRNFKHEAAKTRAKARATFAAFMDKQNKKNGA